jgi:hypothetical protein
MRILIAIPHYHSATQSASPDGRAHGSLGPHADSRVAALSACIASLHQLYGPSQYEIDQATRVALPANARTAGAVDVVICTTGDAHVLDRLSLSYGTYRRHTTACPPPLLGFECHALLRDRLGEYDYYGYMEDDLIARDPWFFVKLQWFNRELGDDAVLQPNRFEVNPRLGLVHKAYLDGDLLDEATAPFQDVRASPLATGTLLGTTVTFQRARNPHAGCFFLNPRQMEAWSRQPYFLDRDTSFIGPLESAATLGLMRAFRVYKSSPESAGFLEVEHFGTSFLDNLRRRGDSEGPPQ